MHLPVSTRSSKNQGGIRSNSSILNSFADTQITGPGQVARTLVNNQSRKKIAKKLSRPQTTKGQQRQ